MIRVSKIFVAVCMVLLAASFGIVLFAAAGLSAVASVAAAAVALILMALYHAVALRMNQQGEASEQIANLSRGTADLARQVAEIGRRLAAVENRLGTIENASKERDQTALGEIGELGTLVNQLAMTVADHDDKLTLALEHSAAQPSAAELRAPEPRTEEPATIAPALVPEPASASRPQKPPVPANILPALRTAIDANRIDLFLQPIVTLPQRKVRFYEAVARLRDENDAVIAAETFVDVAEEAGLIARIDHMVIFRCVQVLRRLMVRNKDVNIFCNMSAATLADSAVFAQCLDYLDANRALAPSFIIEFKQSTFDNLDLAESEHLAALAQRGFRFSIDHVTDLRLEPRELADRGVRFIKVPASLLLDERQSSVSNIHPADLSDLLGRFGIDLIVERIEGESAVLDLLDYDVRFGQGFLFSPPRPLKPEAAAVNSPRAGTSGVSASANAGPAQSPPPSRPAGLSALARRASGPV